jgi:hypothetical protein
MRTSAVEKNAPLHCPSTRAGRGARQLVEPIALKVICESASIEETCLSKVCVGKQSVTTGMMLGGPACGERKSWQGFVYGDR